MINLGSKIARIYTNPIAPPFKSPLRDIHNNKTRSIVEIILIGTLLVTCCLMLILISSIIIFHNTYVIGRLIVGLVVFFYLSFAWLVVKKGRLKIAAWLLISLYATVSLSILLIWGINAPIGILMLAFVIFLSSIMLGSRYIIPVTIGVVILIICLQLLNFLQVVHPDKSPLVIDSSFGDVASYGTIFAVYALIAWIAGNQKEQALIKTLKAEDALEKERDFLEIRLEKRTKLLREAQMKEIRQLYRFAGLGQLTTMILHELANNLSVLTLDIDDLKQRHRHSESINRVQESIDYMDKLVEQVRDQLKESDKPMRFNSLKVIKDCVSNLTSKAIKYNVSLDIKKIDNIRSFYVTGDPLRLSQTITILINNALDAYRSLEIFDQSVIVIQLRLLKKQLAISIIDYGPGVPLHIQKNLFKPLNSTKENGLGIGLFIAREVIENHFKGSLELKSHKNHTEFIIKIPS